MSVCRTCGGIGGLHYYGCRPKPAPTYRIEWFGSLQVHQPVKPVKP